MAPAFTRYRALSGAPVSPKRFAKADEERGEAPVEADHDPVVAGAPDDVEDAVDLCPGEGQGLLDEHGLALLERAADVGGVRVVPGDDEDGVHRRVGQDASASVVVDSKPKVRWAFSAESDRSSRPGQRDAGVLREVRAAASTCA
jgi:hypothetical protein